MLTILTIVLILQASLVHFSNTNATLDCGALYLTETYGITLNWNWDGCQVLPDAITLTKENPAINPRTKNLTKIIPSKVRKGYYPTKIKITDKLPGGWDNQNSTPILDSQCFNYFITSYKNGSIHYTNCYSIQPTWMKDFGELRINEMMLPGTHNSGAFTTKYPGFTTNYMLNSNQNFWNQLVYGIRYFDIRLGVYGTPPSNLFINHDFVKCTPLIPELENIVKFLKKSPKEIVILDFHRFPHPKTFTDNHHRTVLATISKILGNYTLPRPKTLNNGPKLKEIWQIDKRVIISYSNTNWVKKTPWLWQGIQRKWPNTLDLNTLRNYIKYYTLKPPVGNPLWVIMAELTPTLGYILLHPDRSLKYLANMVNIELTNWIREIRNNSLNIVATDFFTGNDVINYAIQINYERLKKQH